LGEPAVCKERIAMSSGLNHIDEAVACIRDRLRTLPEIGLILGSGLGVLADELADPVIIPFGDIPHFPVSTVAGHSGMIVAGTLEGRQVLILKGRVHYYEGYGMRKVAFPVYVMKRLGVKTLIVTNAAGGMNPSFAPGDLMLITDHINFTGDNPLIGPNADELGPRFPDMSQPYDRGLRELAKETAARLGIRLQEGVYAAVSGPSYCTPAELRMLAALGGDAVGMSTVPEVIAAAHCGLRTLGITCITDMAVADHLEPLTHEQVVRVAEETRPKFVSLLKAVISGVNES